MTKSCISKFGLRVIILVLNNLTIFCKNRLLPDTNKLEFYFKSEIERKGISESNRSAPKYYS